MIFKDWLSTLPQRLQMSLSQRQLRKPRRRRNYEAIQYCAAEVLEVKSLLSAGAIDLSFGTNGTQLVNVGTAAAGETATSMAVNANGQIIVAGSATGGATGSDFALTELNANGSVNTSFGVAGHVILNIAGTQNDQINSVAVDASGKIVVAGTTSDAAGVSDAVVARFNADGTLDTTFGTNGMDVFDFTGDSQHDSAANAVTIDGSGNIVVAGSALIGSGASAHTEFAVARLNADGSFDSTFGTDGQMTVDFAGANESANAVAIDAQGRIVVVGSANVAGPDGTFDQFAVARLTAEGTLDNTFGANANGETLVDFGHTADATQIAIGSNGKIDVGGNSTISGTSSIALAQLNADGTLDTTFGANGTTTASFNSGASAETLQGLTIDASGKLVAAATLHTGTTGSLDVGVARFNANGTLDSTFGTAGEVREKFSDGIDSVAGVAIDSNGNLIVAGSSTQDSASASAINFAALQLNGSAAVTTSTFRPLTLDYTGAFSGTAGSAGAFDEAVTGSGTINFTSATQGSAASLPGTNSNGSVTFSGLTNVTINNGQVQATVNGSATGVGNFSVAATGTFDVSTNPYAVTLSFTDPVTGVTGTFSGTISDTNTAATTVTPSTVTFDSMNGLQATINVTGQFPTAASMSTPAATVAVYWATGTSLTDKIGNASIVDSASLPVYFDSGTLNLTVSPDDLKGIPAGATNILVATTLNGTTTVQSAALPSLVIPNIAGAWMINGHATSITQNGSALTFTNEDGATSSGTVVSSNEVQATQWGNLTATLSSDGNTLTWSNGTVWTKGAVQVNIAGTWTINGKQTSIQQTGTSLVFTNENGQTSAGMFIGSEEVEATGWGDLTGTLVNNNTQINWSNGTSWTLSGVVVTPPDISGAWMYNGKSTQIAQAGNSLTFTNEVGGTSAGTFDSSTQVTATGWGNLVGTLSNNDDTITWSNGTVWTKGTITAPSIAGTWSYLNKPTEITQAGSSLTFTNEVGGTSAGFFVSSTEVEATGWGDLTGTLADNNTQIDWSNGTTWTLTALS